jgi:hypothetical protein
MLGHLPNINHNAEQRTEAALKKFYGALIALAIACATSAKAETVNLGFVGSWSSGKNGFYKNGSSYSGTLSFESGSSSLRDSDDMQALFDNFNVSLSVNGENVTLAPYYAGLVWLDGDAKNFQASMRIVDPARGRYNFLALDFSSIPGLIFSDLGLPSRSELAGFTGTVSAYSDDAHTRSESPFAAGTQIAPAAPIPEPSVWATMIGGLAAAGFMARRRKRC